MTRNQKQAPGPELGAILGVYHANDGHTSATLVLDTIPINYDPPDTGSISHVWMPRKAVFSYTSFDSLGNVHEEHRGTFYYERTGGYDYEIGPPGYGRIRCQEFRGSENFATLLYVHDTMDDQRHTIINASEPMFHRSWESAVHMQLPLVHTRP